MNTIARLFRELMDVMKQAPESERTDVLLADIAARVADKGFTCLGTNNHFPLIAACLLLSAYDVMLSYRRRKDDVLIIYAQPSERKPSEYKNKVRVRVAKRLLRMT
jgi:hypothetical protein